VLSLAIFQWLFIKGGKKQIIIGKGEKPVFYELERKRNIIDIIICVGKIRKRKSKEQ